MTSKKSERIKVSFEYPIKCSPNILFSYLSTPSGLSDWFSENVKTKSHNHLEFHFEDGEIIEATVLKEIPNRLIRFHLADSLPEEYLEMEVIVDELTSDVIFKVTEFCFENQFNEYQELWDSEFDQLKSALGVA